MRLTDMSTDEDREVLAALPGTTVRQHSSSETPAVKNKVDEMKKAAAIEEAESGPFRQRFLRSLRATQLPNPRGGDPSRSFFRK